MKLNAKAALWCCLVLCCLANYSFAQSNDVKARVKWEQAKLALERGNYENALSLFEEAMQLLAPYPELLYNAARAAYESGHVDKAYNYIYRVLGTTDAEFKKSPEYAEAFKLAAKIEEAKKAYDERKRSETEAAERERLKNLAVQKANEEKLKQKQLEDDTQKMENQQKVKELLIESEYGHSKGDYDRAMKVLLDFDLATNRVDAGFSAPPSWQGVNRKWSDLRIMYEYYLSLGMREAQYGDFEAAKRTFSWLFTQGYKTAEATREIARIDSLQQLDNDLSVLADQIGEGKTLSLESNFVVERDARLWFDRDKDVLNFYNGIGKVYAYSISLGTKLRSVNLPKDFYYSTTKEISVDRGFIVTWDFQRLQYASTVTGKKMGEIKFPSMINDEVALLSQQCKRFAFCSYDNNIYLYDTFAARELWRSTMQPSEYKFLSFDANGEFLAGSFSDLRSKVWSVENGSEILTVTLKDRTTPLLFDPNGKFLLQGSASGEIKIWSFPKGDEIKTIKLNYRISELKISPQGRFLAVKEQVMQNYTSEEIIVMDLLKEQVRQNNVSERIIVIDLHDYTEIISEDVSAGYKIYTDKYECSAECYFGQSDEQFLILHTTIITPTGGGLSSINRGPTVLYQLPSGKKERVYDKREVLPDSFYKNTFILGSTIYSKNSGRVIKELSKSCNKDFFLRAKNALLTLCYGSYDDKLHYWLTYWKLPN